MRVSYCWASINLPALLRHTPDPYPSIFRAANIRDFRVHPSSTVKVPQQTETVLPAFDRVPQSSQSEEVLRGQVTSLRRELERESILYGELRAQAARHEAIARDAKVRRAPAPPATIKHRVRKLAPTQKAKPARPALTPGRKKAARVAAKLREPSMRSPRSSQRPSDTSSWLNPLVGARHALLPRALGTKPVERVAPDSSLGPHRLALGSRALPTRRIHRVGAHATPGAARAVDEGTPGAQ